MPLTLRHCESIIRIAEANARMHLRHNVTEMDIDCAIGLILESFIQCQKHGVAERLRKSFGRYISKVEDRFKMVAHLLEKQYTKKDRWNQILARDGAEPEITAVHIDELKKACEEHDLDDRHLDEYIKSTMFTRTFIYKPDTRTIEKRREDIDEDLEEDMPPPPPDDDDMGMGMGMDDDRWMDGGPGEDGEQDGDGGFEYGEQQPDEDELMH
mmetsp:Transcript_31221/g.90601  ORF Transcript_31221/g.90601 Transcript_31221/m.90601 type:complete len:212 (-) Transcript_31221:38-673(-)